MREGERKVNKGHFNQRVTGGAPGAQPPEKPLSHRKYMPQNRLQGKSEESGVFNHPLRVSPGGLIPQFFWFASGVGLKPFGQKTQGLEIAIDDVYGK